MDILKLIEILIKEYINTKEFAQLDPTLCQCPKLLKHLCLVINRIKKGRFRKIRLLGEI